MAEEPGLFGVVTLARRGGGDWLLSELVARAEAAGRPVIALVRAEVPGEEGCDMSLRLVPGGRVQAISQSLGRAAEACALDQGALEQAVAETEAALHASAPGTPLILNKFGKVEAAGHGCRPLIALALETGHPVLTSVAPENRAAFDAFAEGLAEDLPADLDGLERFLWPQGRP